VTKTLEQLRADMEAKRVTYSDAADAYDAYFDAYSDAYPDDSENDDDDDLYDAYSAADAYDAYAKACLAHDNVAEVAYNAEAAFRSAYAAYRTALNEGESS